MNKTTFHKTIDSAYSALHSVISSHDLDKTYRAILAEERAHRRSSNCFERFKPTWSITSPYAAKLILARDILQYATLGRFPPKIEDYFSYRQSAFMCAALAARYGRKILERFQEWDIDPDTIIALDYHRVVDGDFSPRSDSEAA